MSDEPDKTGQGPLTATPERMAVQIAIRLGALICFVYVSLTLVMPFAGIFIWSVILAVATYPGFLWLRDRLGGRAIPAALIVTLLLLVLVFGPIAALGSSMIVSLEGLARTVKGGTFELPPLPPFVADLPFVGTLIDSDRALAGSDFQAFVAQYGHMVALPGEWVLRVIERLAGSVLVFAAAVVVSGILLTSEPGLSDQGRRIALRLAGPHGERFVRLAGLTIKNVAQGIIGIALAQALAVGLALMIAGVPHAGLLAVLTLFLGISQIGSGLVILPLVIWFWVTKDWTSALAFTLAMVPVYALEHVAKPFMMSRGLETPTFVILIGVLGGTVVYGLPGLFLGPIVLTVFYELLLLWIGEAGPSDDAAVARKTTDS